MPQADNTRIEPSVEEILASIKQVMARDTRAMLAAQRGRGGAAGDDDVLDLADMAQVAPVATPIEPPLIAPGTADSARGSLDALARLAETAPAPRAEPASDGALELLVRELLRPALAAWLDANLPPIVERLVAAEIARIVGKR